MTLPSSGHITGLPGGSKAYYLSGLWDEIKTSLIVVTSEDLEAEGLSADLEAWAGLKPATQRPPVIYFPELDEAARIAALGRWTADKRAVLFCSATALAKPVFSPEQLKGQTLELRPGTAYPRTKLLEKLAQGGYSRTDMVEMEGELAVRGEVVDLWPATIEKPWRLLFDGDTLESIREFAPGTQRSQGYLQPQKLLPFKETKPAGTLVDHIPEGTVWFWDDVDDRIGVSAKRGIGDTADTPTRRHAHTILYNGLPRTGAIDLGYKSTTGLASGIERTAELVRQATRDKRKVMFFSHNTGESERLQELLEENLGAQGTEEMEFLVGPLRSGFWTGTGRSEEHTSE